MPAKRVIEMQNRTAWTSTVWGSGGANAERLVMPKGEENCHICMEAQVEVAMKPCAHEICLECCNRLRAANIFKVRPPLLLINRVRHLDRPSTPPAVLCRWTQGSAARSAVTMSKCSQTSTGESSTAIVE